MFFVITAPLHQMHILFRCLVHHLMHINPKLSLSYLVSLETFGILLEFKIKFWRLERCLPAQRELTYPPMDC